MSNTSNKRNEDQNQWIFLANENCLEVSPDEENLPTICKLRHPKTDGPCLCMFTHGDTKLYEITQYKEEFRSWFIGDTVQQDGSMFITNLADPIYYVLPYLIKAGQSGKFKPLDQLIDDEEFPECSRLCQCDSLSDLDQVAEVKGDDDFRAYRYSQEKALSWLRLKVERVADTLESKQFNVTDGAQVETFVQSKSDSKREDFVRYAYSLVTEYLPVSLSVELKTFLGIKDIVHEKPAIKEPPAKRSKTGPVEPTEDYSDKGIKAENNNTKKMSAAQKKLNKVDRSGMKNISSFFGKPKQKT